ncbi:hypothetical protein EVAR_16254_1 [Eumeta japonica]|uniref:Uncharacterized protein n=1 Tax=Eumeta variegata TaxID=151549 RepID=A0A4C1U5S5_EUMVA|nr:hypothetical protein EVAR_16254_1 [Eumeta japonica]
MKYGPIDKIRYVCNFSSVTLECYQLRYIRGGVAPTRRYARRGLRLGPLRRCRSACPINTSPSPTCGCHFGAAGRRPRDRDRSPPPTERAVRPNFECPFVLQFFAKLFYHTTVLTHSGEAFLSRSGVRPRVCGAGRGATGGRGRERPWAAGVRASPAL